MINVDTEIAQLLGNRCFTNACSGPDCKLDTFPKEIRTLIEKVRKEERQRVYEKLEFYGVRIGSSTKQVIEAALGVKP